MATKGYAKFLRYHGVQTDTTIENYISWPRWKRQKRTCVLAIIWQSLPMNQKMKEKIVITSS